MANQEVVVQIGADIQAFQSAMSNVQQSMQDTANSVENAMNGAENSTTKSTASIKNALLGVTAVFTAVAGASLVASNQIADGVRNFQTKLGATGDSLKEYETIMNNIAKTGVGSFDEVSNAIISVQQSMKGLQPKELEAISGQAMQLAQVMGSDVTEVSKTAGIMMKNFGISGQEAMDLIAKGYQNGLDYAGDYQDTLSEYSVYFDTMGFSAKDMFNVLAEGASKGAFNLDKVGDAMKEFGIRSKDGSKATNEAFKALGFNAKELGATFAKGGEGAKKAYAQVVTELSKVKNEQERNAIGVALFGTQYEDMEKDVIASTASIKDSMGEVGGTAEQIAKDNVSFSQMMQGAWNSIQLAIKPIGDVLKAGISSALPYIISGIEKLGNVLKGIDINTVKEGFSTFGGYVKDVFVPVFNDIQTVFEGLYSVLKESGAISDAQAVFEGFKDVLGWIKDNTEVVTAVLLGLGGAFLTFQILTGINTAIGIFNTLITAMRTGTLMATLAQWGLNTALLANPFTWIAVGIGALIAIVVLLWKNWDSVSKWLGESWAWISEMSSTIWGGITNFFKKWGATILVIFSGPIGWLVAFIVKNWESISEGAVRIFNGIMSFLSRIWTSIRENASSSWNGFKSMISNIWDGIKSNIKSKIDGIKETITGMWTKAKEIAGKIKGAFTNIFTGIKMPKFSVKGSLNPKNWATQGLPKLGISWHKEGGIFSNPSLIGIGEAGDEAVIPLNNKAHVRPFAKAVASMIPQAKNQGIDGEIVIHVHTELDGKELAKNTIRLTQDLLADLTKKQNRLIGLYS